MLTGISFQVDAVAVVVLIIGVIATWVRMQSTIESNKKLSNVEISNIISTVESIKEDLKEYIQQANEAQSRALNDTKAELKEDICRLEKKQAESNCIKERLAKTEIWIENMRQLRNK